MDAIPLFNFDPPAKVVKAEPKFTGYPVRGNLWSHPGNIHAHLKTGEHRGKWPSVWIDSLTVAQAESLHSDDHEGRVKWQYVPKAVVEAPAVRYTLPSSYSTCPTGNCPTTTSWRLFR